MQHFTYKYGNKADEQDEELPTLPMYSPPPRKPYQHYEHQLTAQQIHFYISEDIKSPEQYTEMVHRILTALPSDTIYIHLNTPGGRLDTGIQIINAMHNSNAKVVTVLESMAYSLGTLIFLAGDEMIINDHCMMMFHNFKGGILGKGNELISQLDATVKWFTALAKQIYVPFLSEDEFERMLRGEDLWMQSPEIRKRLDKMFKTLQKQEKQEKQKAKPQKQPEPPTEG